MPDFYEVDIPPLPEPRTEASHKGDFGHVLVIAGSRRMMGAASLCGMAAVRAGAGLVTLGCPSSMQPRIAQAWPTMMTLPLRETFDGGIALGAWDDIEAFSSTATVLAVGPGLGRSPSTELLVRRIIERSKLPVVLDADGLNAFARHPELLGKAKAPVVITPHPGEMARLTGQSAGEVDYYRRSVATDFAQQHHLTVVLKGANTIVAGSGQVFTNMSGNPYMASGGTGDVLTGMVAGLLAQKLSPFEAARAAVYWHGLAADRVPSSAGPGAVTAVDILDQLRQSGSGLDWYNEELHVDEDHVFDPDAANGTVQEDDIESW